MVPGVIIPVGRHAIVELGSVGMEWSGVEH